MQKIKWYNNISKLFMSRGYLRKGQTIEDKIEEMGNYFQEIIGIPGYGNKFIEYAKKGYYIIPTPAWTNFNKNTSATAISCYGMYISDTVDSVLDGTNQLGMQSKKGGGSSGFFDMRHRGSSISGGGVSNGPVSFMEMFQTTAKIISQASRRGHFCATLDVNHPDIEEFLAIRSDGHPIQDLSFSVSIDDGFMNNLLNEDSKAMKTWSRIIESRFNTGYPYIFFSDTVNNNAPEAYKEHDKRIWASNMCHEICLSSSESESFVCDLLGMNLELFDEWKDTDAVEVGVFLLDAMLTDFIEKNKDVPYMEKNVKFAVEQRAIGLGASGYHSYLQSNMIPFDSIAAKVINKLIFKTIKEQAYEASVKLANILGKPELLKDDKYKHRHVTLLAVAPNTSSSFIMAQQSQSIEPYISNFYVKDVAKTRIDVKNPYLKKILSDRGYDNDEVWKSILLNNGSVQHLDILSEEEKEVFKTFSELNQFTIIDQAADRQKYICQSQSLNIMVPLNTHPDDISSLMIYAWMSGIKTLYYQLNVNVAQEFTNDLFRQNECASCSG